MAEPVNTPIPACTPRSTSPAPHLPSLAGTLSPAKLSALSISAKPKVLHVFINTTTQNKSVSYAALGVICEIQTVTVSSREELIQGFDSRKWSHVDAIIISGEIVWDDEIVGLLPAGVKVVLGQRDGGDLTRWQSRGIAYISSDEQQQQQEGNKVDASRGVKKMISLLDAVMKH